MSIPFSLGLDSPLGGGPIVAVVSDSWLRIGPFSRASSLSIKALRAYHEQGLLVPAEVDPETGYRVYAASQLLDAAVLRRLRDLDVPLRQVREVLDARDPQVTEQVLAEHARVMRERLDDTLRIIGELQRGVDEPATHTPVHLRDEPARQALMLDGRGITNDDFELFSEEAYARLEAAAAAAGARATDVPSALYPQQVDDDVSTDLVAYLAVDRAVAVPAGSGVRLGEVPAARVAVATHVGSFDDIEDTYRRLGGWVAANAEPRPIDVRERYLVSPPAPEDELLTEIHWPVESGLDGRNHP
jgi:DNA-binding transcriptional MerR regulator